MDQLATQLAEKVTSNSPAYLLFSYEMESDKALENTLKLINGTKFSKRVISFIYLAIVKINVVKLQ